MEFYLVYNGSLTYNIQITVQHVPHSQRHCDRCASDNIGDAQHALFQCSDNNLCAARTQFFTDIKQVNNQFQILSDNCKFEYLFACADQDITKIFADFLLKVITY